MDKRIAKAYNIIKRKYQQKLLLKDIASEVGLSPFHFQRLFKLEMKESPTACLNRIRLERSAHLLKTGGDWLMSDIAEDCGFTSLSAFSRAFSLKFGMPPKKFLNDTGSSAKVIFLKLSVPMSNLNVEVVYRPDQYIFYNHTYIYNKDLLEEFIGAKSFCELNHIPSTGKLVGVSNHITFHYPKDKMNYYAGVEIKVPINSYKDRIFHATSGKYACFYTEESCQEIQQIMMQFKIEWMDKSNYTRRDLFSIEEYYPDNKKTDYPNFKRKIFVPLKLR